jgi:hypothetical protein
MVGSAILAERLGGRLYTQNRVQQLPGLGKAAGVQAFYAGYQARHSYI